MMDLAFCSKCKHHEYYGENRTRSATGQVRVEHIPKPAFCAKCGAPMLYACPSCGKPRRKMDDLCCVECGNPYR